MRNAGSASMSSRAPAPHVNSQPSHCRLAHVRSIHSGYTFIMTCERQQIKFISHSTLGPDVACMETIRHTHRTRFKCLSRLTTSRSMCASAWIRGLKSWAAGRADDERVFEPADRFIGPTRGFSKCEFNALADLALGMSSRSSNRPLRATRSRRLIQ